MREHLFGEVRALGESVEPAKLTEDVITRLVDSLKGGWGSAGVARLPRSERGGSRDTNPSGSEKRGFYG